jgi:polyisoprenoid-binding protein YceI
VRNIIASALIFFSACFQTLEAQSPRAIDTQTFELAAKDVKINWVGKKKLGSKHDGTLVLQKAQVEVKSGELLTGNFEVDMTKLVVLDIKDPENNAKLKRHLESDDFFSVARFPTATFEMTRVEKLTEKSNRTHQLHGNLTIKGMTEKIDFPATVVIKGDSVSISSLVTVDRTKYGIRYASENFFENLVGDRVISDNFEVSFDIELKRSQKTPS